MDNKLYAVFMECEDMEPVLTGIATSRDAAIAMAKASNEEFEGAFQYRLSSCPANTIHMNDCTFLYDNNGELVRRKNAVAGKELFHIWETEELDFPEIEREE